MEHLFRITLFIAGIINTLPSLLAFLPDKISTSYGIDVTDPNLELLLRHRAILFGIVGVFMMYSAIVKHFYTFATAAGLISMVSFIILYFLIGTGINTELRTVMIVDVVAAALLCLGLGLYLLKPTM